MVGYPQPGWTIWGILLRSETDGLVIRIIVLGNLEGPVTKMSDSSGGYTDYEFVAEYYDHVVPYRNREDIEFYLEFAKEAGGPGLELGCGSGRVLLPLARAGIQMTGLDLSPHMLNVCRAKLREEEAEVQERVTLVQGDMVDFSLESEFTFVTTPFRPFQHLLTVEDQLACLACIHEHLVPGGPLVLDLFNPSLSYLTDDAMLEEHGEEEPFEMPDGRVVRRTHRTISRDPFQQVNDQELIYTITHPDGRQERVVHSFRMRYLFRFEVEHLLARSGFVVEQVYADFARNPYGSKYPGELLVVARRT
jgi:SAM-dependent methyltransferase